VVWNDETKNTAHGSLRIDATVLHVAVARLLGYRWPTETDKSMKLAPEMREWLSKCDELLPYAVDNGIISLRLLQNNESASEKLRNLLAAAYGNEWSQVVEKRLLQAVGGNRSTSSLEEWLQERFFEEHCKLFGHHPFIWHIWDGRKDGFSVLVNYHKLAGIDGRRTLENITYTHLGEWINRQQIEQREERDGAEGRLTSAISLQTQLEKILEGEPPYDIFVRWKPLYKQPIGWTPDINDGVRINIRPFLSASLSAGSKFGLLRYRPSINWGKDRGKDSQRTRPKEDYPWLWQYNPDSNNDLSKDFMGGSGFDGNRWNNLHYSNTIKRDSQMRTREVSE
jgi:hypothetical protein